jgi:hypothetical protein
MLALPVLVHTRGILGIITQLRMKTWIARDGFYIDPEFIKTSGGIHSWCMCSTLLLAACFLPIRWHHLTFPIAQSLGPTSLI